MATRLRCDFSIQFVIALFAIALLSPRVARADVQELAKIPLEDLMHLEVSSVLRKDQPAGKAPAALYVITAEDIRRSGATNIPDLLRMVPGVTVQRTGSSSWSITARGFDSDGSSKLLVQIDGRSVYTPLFSGVFWDVQDLVLEDIERIEVIRGPGAVSWGENAVNGVINIITKSSKDTTGTLAKVGGGDEEKVFASARQGGEIGEDTTYRVYGKYFSRDESRSPTGGGAGDEWFMTRGGFRLDSNVTSKDTLTFQGDIYSGNTDTRGTNSLSFSEPTPITDDVFDLNGGNFLARWARKISPDEDIQLYGYYDRTERTGAIFGEDRDSFHIDFQHRSTPVTSHEVVWGANYHLSSDDMENSIQLSLIPDERTDEQISAFIQDDIRLTDWLHLIPGIKAGYNDYTGFEHQPALKLAAYPTESQTIWSSVSRAVRIPARIDDDVRITTQPVFVPGQLPASLALFGQRDFESEDLLAYELGYRAEVMENLWFDVAAFYHEYDDLISGEPGTPFIESDPSPDHTIIPLVIENKSNGRVSGVELFSNWRALDWLDLKASYSYIELEFTRDPDSLDTITADVAYNTPHNQATFRAAVDLPYDTEFDTMLYYVDGLTGRDVSDHLRLDLRFGWLVSKGVRLDVVAQDIADGPHQEAPRRSLIEPSVFGKITVAMD